jgi:hypothetical protein
VTWSSVLPFCLLYVDSRHETVFGNPAWKLRNVAIPTALSAFWHS